MKRSILFVIVLCCIAAQLTALDFGVNLSNNTEIGGIHPSVYLSQHNKAEVYVQIPTGSLSSVYLSADVRFYGLFPLKPRGKADFLPAAQSFRLGRTEWTGAAVIDGMGLNWGVGRTYFNDYSHKVLNGLFDGAQVRLTFPQAEVSFAAGYTGLTYKNDAKIRIDADDTERLFLQSTVLAPQRLFLSASAAFPELIPSYTFGLDVLGQFDLIQRKTATHTQYFIPYIHGKMHRNLNWKFWGALQFGEDGRAFYSAASGLLLYYFNPQWRNFTVRGTLDWAAGDYDRKGAMRAFIPVTHLSHTRIAKTPFSDTLTAGLSASVRPVQGLMTELAYTMLTTPNNRKEAVYTGSELLAALGYGFYNDFNLSVLSGVFIPKKQQGQTQQLRWLAEIAFKVKL
ncbi:MAG: hypothetical protein P1P65_00395 [Treponema sp.]